MEGDELQRVLDLAERNPNVTGDYPDDFLRKTGRGALSVDDLANIRPRLNVVGRRLDLWVVLYIRQLDLPVAPYLEHCDVGNLWTENSDDLKDLERNLVRLKAINPGGRVRVDAAARIYGRRPPCRGRATRRRPIMPSFEMISETVSGAYADRLAGHDAAIEGGLHAFDRPDVTGATQAIYVSVPFF